MRKIIFSRRSKLQLEELIEYLEYRFSLITKEKFVATLDRFVVLIQKDPEIFPKSEANKKIRKCVISKQTTLYYSFNNQEIRLLSFFDTRQDPTKIKKII
ncbi:type II toxin-antitoxin system RelE/ParE family toxin [Flavobacterium sp.]|uniref:type II toxin-antitoxin system RelE/ParE family toxin n=1 Tax=Flavobacterium sp. TaxID=239 RepID=UPI0022CC8F4A|nr:type II toxin-antitoxin system RelE/ParE family toxin [Flavobacterium sp.]MCZ8230226.1 type II toxin-antitoxin system RelE/ParE family toxin [Flavobacterium sp.]